MTQNATAPIANMIPKVISHASASDGTISASCSGSVVSECAPELASRIERDRQRDQRAERQRRGLRDAVGRRTDGSGRSRRIDSMPVRMSSKICHATQLLVSWRTISTARKYATKSAEL